MAEFRAQIGCLLPGSLTADGDIVDCNGTIDDVGPCYVDLRKLKTARRAAMGKAGWKVAPVSEWPPVPVKGLTCIWRSF